jgi:outer membrane usher protein FimD/PapC
MKLYVALALCICLVPSSAVAQVGRRGGGQRVNVQNRSANVNRNYNANTNVNRNVNVNQNVNVNRNVNVNVHGGCYNCGYYHDNDWNWGSFAAGAAVGAVTTAAVASAAHSSSNTTVVVQAPAVGAVVSALPGKCATISSGGAMIYNCSNIYYRPYYQGTQLVYQVVTYP